MNINNFYEIEKSKREVGFQALGKSTVALELPPPVQSEFTENMRSKQDFKQGLLQKENQSKMLHSSTSKESFHLKRAVIGTEQERSLLPNIKPSKLQFKRRPLSLIELSIQQKLNLQKILKENHPLYAIGDAFWSAHWLETRSLLLLNQTKQSSHNGSDDSIQDESDHSSPNAESIESISNESEVELQSAEKEDQVSARSRNIQTILSLEDRLLLIEQMHGLEHNIRR